MMKIDKITREDLRAIAVGESRTFELPTYAAVLSAKTTAYATGRIDECRYVFSTERERPVVTITRMPR